jgi:hypothetical protein
VQDNSGTIERDEFLSLPQVSSNPLATRYAFSDPRAERALDGADGACGGAAV